MCKELVKEMWGKAGDYSEGYNIDCLADDVIRDYGIDKEKQTLKTEIIEGLKEMSETVYEKDGMRFGFAEDDNEDIEIYWWDNNAETCWTSETPRWWDRAIADTSDILDDLLKYEKCEDFQKSVLMEEQICDKWRNISDSDNPDTQFIIEHLYKLYEKEIEEFRLEQFVQQGE